MPFRDREKALAYQREYKRLHPKSKAGCPAQREYNFQKKYGISTEQYNEMLKRQGGVCAICGQEETATRKGVVRALCVDHDHATGAVRSLLCAACNCAIGYMNDDPARLRAAADYLEGGIRCH